MEGLFNSPYGIIIYFAFLFGVMWFIMVRPQRKREKAIQEMQASIKVGDMVLTNAGMYGKVIDSVNNIFIIEFGLNKGIRIPVEKNAIASVKEPNLSVAKEEKVEVIEETPEKGK
ncbi:MAG TPA: preprotein translocase subunit YajC [Epulopiscium sp.]|nr:preprotein translocase subunit YajC [Candidatus Epulonipiscium sp.]